MVYSGNHELLKVNMSCFSTKLALVLELNYCNERYFINKFNI